MGRRRNKSSAVQGSKKIRKLIERRAVLARQNTCGSESFSPSRPYLARAPIHPERDMVCAVRLAPRTGLSLLGLPVLPLDVALLLWPVTVDNQENPAFL